MARMQVRGSVFDGKLVESADKSQGDRFLDGAPGVYVHKDGTSHKAENYTRYTPLCDDGVFWAAKREVLVDREHHRVRTKRKTDQWVQRSCGVELVALWLCGRTTKDMRPNVPVAKRWEPELEANPRRACWEQRAKAKQHAIDMPEPGLPPRPARVVVLSPRSTATMRPDVVMCPGRASRKGRIGQDQSVTKPDEASPVVPWRSQRLSSTSPSRSRSRSEAADAGEPDDTSEYLAPSGDEWPMADAGELGRSPRLRQEAERVVREQQERSLDFGAASDEGREAPSTSEEHRSRSRTSKRRRPSPSTVRSAPSPEHSPGGPVRRIVVSAASGEGSLAVGDQWSRLCINLW